MASEAVEIIIAADDQASKKFAQVAANAEQSVKRIKEVGQKTKATSEFAGVLANLAGGSQLGQFAGQVGQLTEKVSQFSEVSKLGGAGALAFKAGLIGAVGVLSYSVGSAISGWLFQQKDLNDELEKTVSLMKDSANEANRAAAQAFKDKREDISLLPNKDTQKSELKKLLAETEAELTKQTDLWNSKVELGKTDKLDKEAADFHKSQMDRLKLEAEELKRSLSGRDEAVEKQRKYNSETEKSKSFVKNLEDEVALLRLKGDELLRAKAYQQTNNGDDAKKSFALLKEKEAIDAKTKADEKARQEAEQAAAKEKQRVENIAALRKRENESLDVKLKLLTQGEEAAKALSLEQQGLDKDSARQIAAREKQLKQLEESKKGTGDLMAKESRLLSRGTGRDQALRVAEEQKELLARIAENTAGKQGGLRPVQVAA